jgi:hypothetical protein
MTRDSSNAANSTRDMVESDSGVEWWVEGFVEGQTRHVPVAGEVRVGRAPDMDLVLPDPYVSRMHCVVSIVDGRPFVDARGSRNHIRVAGQDVESSFVQPGEAFLIGRTPFRVLRSAPDETTLLLRPDVSPLVLRMSSHELVDVEGAILARFSAAELAAFALLAQRYPDAATHSELGTAIWAGIGFDQYQIHRLMQRLRQRLGERAVLLENVRGAGYRLTGPVEVR